MEEIVSFDETIIAREALEEVVEAFEAIVREAFEVAFAREAFVAVAFDVTVVEREAFEVVVSFIVIVLLAGAQSVP